MHKVKIFSLISLLVLPLLSGCSSQGPDDKSLRVTRHGLMLKGVSHPLSEKELQDSLVSFCTERKHWLVQADSDAVAADVLPLFRAAMVRQPCKGLYHLRTAFSEMWLMPPIAISRNYYSIDESDSSKPILAMTVYAHPFGIGMTMMAGMLDPVRLAHTRAGQEFIYDASRRPPVAQALVDDEDRCLVPLRQTVCADTLYPHTRYLRIGRVDRVVDTLMSDTVDLREFHLKKKALTLDMALRARLQVIRSLKGSAGKGRYYHFIADSTLNARVLFDRLSSFRSANIDFNTFEVR